MNFQQLCIKLGINDEMSNSQKLSLLKPWFETHISQDVDITQKEPYEIYKQMSENYFKLIANEKLIADEIILEAAKDGLDQIILSLNPDQVLLNKTDKNGRTALHLAAQNGHLQTTKMLLSLGANPNIQNNKKQYPIFSALILPISSSEYKKNSKIKIFNLLLEYGTDNICHQDSDGNTVLQQMIISNFELLISDILKLEPKLVFIANNFGQYPIHNAILNAKFNIVEILLKINKVNALADSKNRIALHCAVRLKNPLILQLCLHYTSNINSFDFEGKSPLMLAAEMGSLLAVQALVNAGASIAQKDNNNFSILHYAVHSGNVELVNWLITQKFVDINATDSRNHTPLSLSENAGREDITELLLKHGASRKNSGYTI